MSEDPSKEPVVPAGRASDKHKSEPLACEISPAARHFAEPKIPENLHNVKPPNAVDFAETSWDFVAPPDPLPMESCMFTDNTHFVERSGPKMRSVVAGKAISSEEASAASRHSESTNRTLAAYRDSQSGYLSASGTLTQFNAIMVAVAGSAIVSTGGPLRFAVAAALVLHVSAAFLLCWAARPVNADRARSPSMALMATIEMANDTFKNYRRGWRATMMAMAASSVSVALYILQTFNGPGADALKRLSFAAW